MHVTMQTALSKVEYTNSIPANVKKYFPHSSARQTHLKHLKV